MAYPTISAPYGFKPINRFDGIPYAGATLQYPIASNYNTPIYNGSSVAIVAGGTIALSGATTTATAIIGVAVGFQYTNSSGQTVQAQYYPGTSVTNAIAYVVVDPTAEFKVAVTTSGAPTVVTGANASIIGANVAEIQNGTGSTTTGDAQSSVVLPANAAGSATTLPWRVVAVVPDTAYVSGGTTYYAEVIVKNNNPQLTALAGVNYAA
jgi:hypothetical protein